MRTVYENYRGFKIYQQENKYQATMDESVTFTHFRLSEVLNTIDSYVDELTET